MPGHHGNRKVTLQNIKVVDVKEDQNLILLKGGIPGSPTGWVLIRSATKSRIGSYREERLCCSVGLRKGNWMTTLAVYDIGNQKVSDIELDDRIFDAKINPSLFYDVVRMDLASERKGTAATKNRALVRGGGAKPWRQKGTGRARAGISTISPLERRRDDLRPHAKRLLSFSSQEGEEGQPSGLPSV